MKFKRIICFLILLSVSIPLTGCTVFQQVGNVTIDNVSRIYTDNKYTVIKGTTLIRTSKGRYKDFDQIEKLVNKWADLVSNRTYTNVTGDEDYITYTKHYKDKLNKDKNDVEFTKKSYEDYKLIFSLDSCKVNQVILGKDFGMARINVTDRLDYAISDDVARQMGYLGGIGDFKSRIFNCIVQKVDGKYLIYDIQQVSK